MADRIKLAALVAVAVAALGALGVVVYNVAANDWRLSGNPLDLSFLFGDDDVEPEPDERTAERSLRFGDSVRAIRVEMRGLRLRVTPSRAPQVDALFTLNGDASDSTLFETGARFIGDTLVLYGAPTGVRGSSSGTLELAVPSAVALTAHVAAGDIMIENVEGTFDVVTDAGSIDVTGMRGSLRCVAASGEVSLDACRLDSARIGAGGAVRMDFVEGDVVVESTQLVARRHFGALVATARLDITADLLTTDRPIRLVSREGDIHLRVLSGARFAYDVEAPGGSIVSNVTFDSLRADDVTEHVLRATTNGGGVPAHLRAGRGSVEIVLFSPEESRGGSTG